MRYTFEDKLYLVQQLQSGVGVKPLCKAYGVCHHDLHHWLDRYEKYGEDGLRRPTNAKHYSEEERRQIVLQHTEKHISLRNICLEYDVDRNTLKSWIRKVRCGVPLVSPREGLTKEKIMARPKKTEAKTEVELLRDENAYLKAENAYLKKLRALVEEEQMQQALSSVFKPSKH